MKDKTNVIVELTGIGEANFEAFVEKLKENNLSEWFDNRFYVMGIYLTKKMRDTTIGELLEGMDKEVKLE